MSSRLRFTSEQNQWIKDHEGANTDMELSKLFAETFGVQVSRGVYAHHRLRLGVKSCYDNAGRYTSERHGPGFKKMPPEIYEKCKGTMFKMGHATHNNKPLGSTYIDKSTGAEMIKVYEGKKRNYVLKSRYMYEQLYGYKPKHGELVIHLNGDKYDYSKDNLALVTTAENAKMRSRKNKDTDIARVNLDIVKVELKIAEKEGKYGKHKNRATEGIH